MQTIHSQKENITFSDLDLNFIVLKNSKDLNINYNEMAIKKSVENLILTKHYEKPFHSNIGCSVYSILFEPMTIATANLLESEINSVLSRFEPRINLSGIEVTPNYEEQSYKININYYIVGKTTPSSATIMLERIR